MEKHNRQFRGWWIPKEIVDLAMSGSISKSDLFLLCIIDSLVGEEDCYASNEYLADQMNVTAGTISRAISVLEEKTLIIITKFDGRRRYMRTCWSDGRLCKDVDADYAKMRSLPDRTIKFIKKDNNTVGNQLKPKTKWDKYAKNFAKAISKRRKVNPNIRQWAHSLSLLHSKDDIEEKRIVGVLRWYCKNIPDAKNEFFIPVAYAAHAFREKFLRIEDAMIRLTEEEIEVSDKAKKKAAVIEDTLYHDLNIEIEDLENTVQAVMDWRSRVFKELTSEHLKDLLKRFEWEYWKWIEKQTSGWDNWSGDMKEFRPSGKHFIRFLDYCIKAESLHPKKVERAILYA